MKLRGRISPGVAPAAGGVCRVDAASNGAAALTRRRVLGGAALACLNPHTSAQAESALRRPFSLPADAEAAASSGQPLILLVNLPGCPYCEAVRRAYLLPLAREQAGVVQIDLTSAARVIDFGGVVSSHDKVGHRLRARFAPTVLFLNARGVELAERLVGAGSDFYGGLLEQRLQTARAAVARR